MDAASTPSASCYHGQVCSLAAKESLDYAQALELCANTRESQYVVVLEDDSYATHNFSWKLRDLVVEVEGLAALRGRSRRRKREKDWLLVKLFVTR